MSQITIPPVPFTTFLWVLVAILAIAFLASVADFVKAWWGR